MIGGASFCWISNAVLLSDGQFRPSNVRHEAVLWPSWLQIKAREPKGTKDVKTVVRKTFSKVLTTGERHWSQWVVSRTVNRRIKVNHRLKGKRQIFTKLLLCSVALKHRANILHLSLSCSILIWESRSTLSTLSCLATVFLFANFLCLRENQSCQLSTWHTCSARTQCFFFFFVVLLFSVVFFWWAHFFFKRFTFFWGFFRKFCFFFLITKIFWKVFCLVS